MRFAIERALAQMEAGRAGRWSSRLSAAEVKRLGDQPVVIPLTTGDATVEVAAPHNQRERLLGPYAPPAAATVAPEPTPVVD